MHTIAIDLDATDRQLLDLLSQDGRASYQSLADRVGLSRPAVMERVKRLEEQGFIADYVAVLNRTRLGLGVTAFVAVRFPAADEADDERARRHMESLAANPAVLECHHVDGDDSYVLKVATATLAELEQVLRGIRACGQQVSTRSTIALSTVFEKSVRAPAVD